ncbi:aminodeoxychorismate/anthranilate synthase component II [Hyphobacterium sp. SN044]|uniref:anthranilate synthase component II n=1 Tax=Hyphobacterium sp. SN044 TaxID=2912575 RepID=UPI001F3BDA0A|nr:aminodeoxychorismate/anthranilate synthase component II [Hyphobacterium sp. SN044]MCF8879105.1 aminodeoxychorismate/anthranilate synthase component II [Hyphobacterium sp. SN044]
MLLIIDNYDSFTFNLVHYFQELGAETRVVRNDAMSAAEAISSGAAGIVISPGPGRPADAGICPELIKTIPADLPLLGVCLGHQGIGEAFGGKIVQAKSIMHGKTSAITHDGSGVFAGLPSPFEVTRYHSLAVDEASLSDEIVVNARAEDGEIMGLRHRERPIHGVQFHPESIASQYGHEVLANFLSLCGVRPKVAA